MASFYPNDLVADTDLRAYESQILTGFNVTSWADKRRRALEDWLAPILAGRGFDLFRLRTRFEPEAVFGLTSSTYTDVLAAAMSTDADDVDLAAVWATPSTDALYVGSSQLFRGLSLRLLEAVSSVASVLTVQYWADAWTPLVITDGTAKVAGNTCSAGGAITWALPMDWVARTVNSTGPYYWVKVTVSATPTGAKAGQIGVIRRSVLSAPATLRTLLLIMREAPTGANGPWDDKATWYETEADAALQRALPLVGGEYDTDASDQVSATEATQTDSEVGAGPWRMERG